MHLRPAKYHQLQASLAIGSPGQSEEPYGRTLTELSWQQQANQPSMSASSSTSGMVSTLIDGNNNNRASSNQFTASQRQSATSIFNANGNHHHHQNNNANDDPSAIATGGHIKAKAGGKLNQGIILSGSKMRASTTISSNFASGTNQNKIKLMELALINLVELSTMAAEEGKLELALKRAREALEGFNGLKVAVMVQDRDRDGGKGNPNGSANQPGTLEDGSLSSGRIGTAPMTTGVNLYELTLMIQSNLAAQLANNGHFAESIELYTQLCKMANTGAGSGVLGPSVVAMAGGSRNLQQQQHGETRFLLYRFGLNIGNLYYRMEEYQRALKYYRLTLDRLTSSSAYRQMRLKIMHNIALALIAMGQLPDATTSLNLLLADNLTATNESLEQQQQPNQGAYNSNHHEFGLNLMVCQYKQADLNSMMATMRSLSKVAICQQYERALDTSTIQEQAGNESRPRSKNDDGSGSSSSSALTTINRNSPGRSHFDGQQHGRLGDDALHDRDEMSIPSQRQQMMMNRVASDRTNGEGSSLFLGGITSNKTMTSLAGIERVDSTTASEMMNHRQMISLDETGTAGGERLMGGGGGGSEVEQVGCGRTPVVAGVKAAARLMKLSAAERARQLMELVREDRLERLIGGKQRQIAHSLIMGCNLMFDLDNRMAASKTTSPPLPGDNESRPAVADSSSKTSVFEFCLKLLATSDCYKALVYELRANCVSKMLMDRYKFDEAIAMLNGMGSMDGEAQQVDWDARNATATNKSTLKNSSNNKSNNNTNKSNLILDKSSMVATNCSLLNLLKGNTKGALECGNQALRLDKFNVQALVNLANSHYMLNDLDKCEKLYEQALLIDPNCWEANYNLALLNRKLGRRYNELKEPTKFMLLKCGQCFTSLIWNQMILMAIQLALIYHQSGMKQQSFSIVNDLISNQKQAPEIILLASRLIDDNLSNVQPGKEPTGKQSALSILQQANRDHPYHLPVAERLIALNIQSFNYDQSIALLCNCIVNRPDLVKWYQMLAECYRRAADYNKAIATYKIAVDAFPQDTGCLKALIKLTDELGLIEEKRNFSNKLEETLRRFDLQPGTATATANSVDVRYNYA